MVPSVPPNPQKIRHPAQTPGLLTKRFQQYSRPIANLWKQQLKCLARDLARNSTNRSHTTDVWLFRKVFLAFKFITKPFDLGKNVAFYLFKFHSYFDGILGYETLSELEALLDISNHKLVFPQKTINLQVRQMGPPEITLNAHSATFIKNSSYSKSRWCFPEKGHQNSKCFYTIRLVPCERRLHKRTCLKFRQPNNIQLENPNCVDALIYTGSTSDYRWLIIPTFDIAPIRIYASWLWHPP